MNQSDYEQSRADFERWLTVILHELYGWNIYLHKDDQLIKEFDIYGATDYHVWRWHPDFPNKIRQTFRLCMRVQWERIYPTFTIGCRCKDASYQPEITKLCAAYRSRAEFDFPQWNIQCYGDKRGGNLLYFGIIRNEELIKFHNGAKEQELLYLYKMPGEGTKEFLCFPYYELSKYTFRTYVMVDGKATLTDLTEWRWKRHDKWSAYDFPSILSGLSQQK